MSAPFSPQPGPPAPLPVPTGAPAPKVGQSTTTMLLIVAGVVAAALGLAGVVFGLTRNDDAGIDTIDTVPEVSTPSTEVPATEVPVETAPADTTPADTTPVETDPPATDSTVSIVDPDEPAALTEISQLLVWTSFSEDPIDDAAKEAEIAALIADRTVEAVAHPTRVSTICAGIPVNAALDLTITWQFRGETVQTDPRSAEPPGVGSCIDNAGEPLAAGSYQVLAFSPDGADNGFVTTFVIGAVGVSQRFVNNSDVDICDIGIAPLDTAYYEFFVSDGGAIVPGELIDIDVASVEQDLRARQCDGADREPFTFVPNSFAEQNLSL